jgi:hypothetical protein
MAFGIGAAVTTASAAVTRAGTARVRVACPASLHRACRGRVQLTRALSASRRPLRRLRVRRIAAGASAAFTVRPGREALVAVRLSRPARLRLSARRRLRLMAIVRAADSAGGSGYGRHVVFTLRSR